MVHTNFAGIPHKILERGLKWCQESWNHT